MKEIGGYIELEHNCSPMMHEGAIALNCGTACLAYLIRAKKIKKIMLPFFLCNCIKKVCQSEGVNIKYYRINQDFLPKQSLSPSIDEWVYVVNFYGQLTKEDILGLADKYPNMIVDQAQAYFQKPMAGIDMIYTCRKFFGVPDGGFLYTDITLGKKLPKDESYERMRFLLGRYERTASEFYSEYAANNTLLENEPPKKMSKLTENLLRGIDYHSIKDVRTANYEYLYGQLKEVNQLTLRKVCGAFSYPLLLHNGAFIRKELIKYKIYIPTLWPNVLLETEHDSLEYYYAENILPLPVDQRYGIHDMQKIKDIILMFL